MPLSSICKCCSAESFNTTLLQTVTKIKMVEGEILDHPELYTTRVNDPILNEIPRSDSMYNVTIAEYPAWILEKMVKYHDDPELFKYGVDILFDRVVERALGDSEDMALSSKSKVSGKVWDWALKYTGPHWEIVYMALLQIYNKADKEKMKLIYETSIKAANAVFEINKEPFDFRLGRFLGEVMQCCENQNRLSSCWDGESGVTFFSWSLEYDQNHPHQQPNYLINVMDISGLLFESSSEMFLRRYWNSEVFLRRIKSFLPTAVKIIPDEQLNFLDGDYYAAIRNFTGWITRLVEEKGFPKVFIEKKLHDPYYSALQLIEKRKTKSDKPADSNEIRGLNQVRSTILIFFLVTLSIIDDKEFTIECLNMLSDPISKCTYEGLKPDEFLEEKLQRFVKQLEVIEPTLIVKQRKDTLKLIEDALASESKKRESRNP